MTSESSVSPSGVPDKKKTSTKERIFQAALTCFSRQGVENTNMADVAIEAGISRPSIYYHFEDKQSLIVEVVLREQLAAYEQRKVDGYIQSRGLKAIVEAAAHGIDNVQKNPYLKIITRPESERLTAIAMRSKRARKLQADYWGLLLKDARERGELRTDLRDDELILWIVLMQLHIVLHGRLMGCTDFSSIYTVLDRFLTPVLSIYANPSIDFVPKSPADPG